MQETEPILTQEGQTVTLTIIRELGSFGEVPVFYSITGADISPNSSSVLFADGQRRQTLSLTITDDSLPEPMESFAVTLTSDRARVSQGQREIRIAASDAPIHFTQVRFIIMHPDKGLAVKSRPPFLSPPSWTILKTNHWLGNAFQKR